VVECTALEMRRAREGTQGSNPCLSANSLAKPLFLLHILFDKFACPHIKTHIRWSLGSAFGQDDPLVID